MIDAQKIHIVVDIGQLALSEEKGGITRQRLVQEIDRFEIILSSQSTKAGGQKQSLGARVKIESGDIFGGRLLDCAFLSWRKFRLQLISDLFCDFTLNGKDIVYGPIIILSPFVGV